MSLILPVDGLEPLHTNNHAFHNLKKVWMFFYIIMKGTKKRANLIIVKCHKIKEIALKDFGNNIGWGLILGYFVIYLKLLQIWGRLLAICKILLAWNRNKYFS